MNEDIQMSNDQINYIDKINESENQIKIITKKLKRSRILNIILAILIILFILVSIAIGIFISIIYNNVKPHFNAIFGKNYNIASVSSIVEHNKLDLEKFSTKLAFFDDIVNMLYYYDKNNEDIENAMYSAYMKALGDKYAEYYSTSAYEDFTEKTTEGVYYGIGCVVTTDLDTNDTIIEQIYEGSPAEKGGLKVGDIFVSVDGEKVRGIELNDLVMKIRGEEGAKRVIEVYRPSVKSNVTHTVYCGKVDIKLVSTEIYENNIGYIDIREFTGKVYTQFKDAMNKLLKKNIKGLIIDLRNNPGGELITVCEMMDYMVRDNDGKYTLNQKEAVFDEGKTLLVYIKEKDNIVDAAYADDKHSVDIPIVILTNMNTASAAELFTECLRDYNKAKVVGIKTYGKGVVQNVIPYDDGSAIKFTVSEYFPPSGYSIDKKGIIPDYSLDFNGGEVLYDDDNNILIDNIDTIYAIDNEGNIVNETKATNSNINIISTSSEIHEENLKIYDTDNSFVNEDWFIELDEKYDDKQILQAIVLLK